MGRMMNGDPRGPRIKGEGPCGLDHIVETKWMSNKWATWKNCQRCDVRLVTYPMLDAPGHTVKMENPSRVKEAIAIFEKTGIPVEELRASMFKGYLLQVKGEHQSKQIKKKVEATDSVEIYRVPSAPSAASPSRALSSSEPGTKSMSLPCSRWSDIVSRLRRIERHNMYREEEISAMSDEDFEHD